MMLADVTLVEFVLRDPIRSLPTNQRHDDRSGQKGSDVNEGVGHRRYRRDEEARDRKQHHDRAEDHEVTPRGSIRLVPGAGAPRSCFDAQAIKLIWRDAPEHQRQAEGDEQESDGHEEDAHAARVTRRVTEHR